MTDEHALVVADENTTVVALTPAEMVPAQAELVAWCDRKIQALSDESDELELHQKLALENGWKTSVVTANLNRTARRITYYQKMQVALQAGYLLVPNMPVDVLAVRVKNANPPGKTSQYPYPHHHQAQPQASLPAGEGRYVDETLIHRDDSYTTSVPGKEPVRHQAYTDAEYDEVDFPFQTMKPVVLQAAARAMALKVFDQIGQVQNSGGQDPILVGQLLDPRGNRRRATFFIAWWVDTKTL